MQHFLGAPLPPALSTLVFSMGTLRGHSTTDVEAEGQQGEATCPESHGSQGQGAVTRNSAASPTRLAGLHLVDGPQEGCSSARGLSPACLEAGVQAGVTHTAARGPGVFLWWSLPRPLWEEQHGSRPRLQGPAAVWPIHCTAGTPGLTTHLPQVAPQNPPGLASCPPASHVVSPVRPAHLLLSPDANHLL